MPKNLIISILCLLSFTLVLGCNDITRHEKFDSEKWKQYESVDGPERGSMAEDLLKTKKLVGLSHKQMLALLGEPSNYTDTTKTYYELSEEYDMIDPVSGKDLLITFNKDSVITNAEIKEWHKH
jgi:hypothetical protein